MSVLSGDKAKEIRNQRNATRLAAEKARHAATPRRAEDNIPSVVNLEVPSGMPTPPGGNVGINISDQLDNPPEGMPEPKSAAARYDAALARARKANGLPELFAPAAPAPAAPPAAAPAAPVSPAPSAPAAALPTAAPEGEEDDEDDEEDKDKKKKTEAAPAQAAPADPAKIPELAGEPPMPAAPPAAPVTSADPLAPADPLQVPPAGDPPAAPGGEPPPAVVDQIKDEAYTEMMSDGETEPQPGQPYAVAFHLFNASSQDPHWLATINGKAYGEIHLSDQSHAAEMRAPFLDANAYVAALHRSVTRDGFAKTMKRVHARRYRAKVMKSDLARQIEAEVRTRVEAEYAVKAAKLREEFTSWLHVANEAMRKNVLHDGTPHPLKEALVKQLSAGMRIHPDQVHALVEAAYAECNGADFVRAAEKATEWMSKPAEFQEAVRKEVRASAVRFAAPSTTPEQAQLRASLTAGNLPIVVPPPVNPRAAQDEQATRVAAALRAGIGSV